MRNTYKIVCILDKLIVSDILEEVILSWNPFQDSDIITNAPKIHIYFYLICSI